MTTTRTLTGPAHWASALVNNDYSSLSKMEAEQCLSWRERELVDGEIIASTADDAEPRFTKSFRLYGGDADGGDVLDYIVLQTGDKEGQ